MIECGELKRFLVLMRICHPSDLDPELVTAWRDIKAAHSCYLSPFYAPEFASITGQCREDARVIVAHDENAQAFAFLPVQEMEKSGLVRPLGAPFCDSAGPILRLSKHCILPNILRLARITAYRYQGFDGVGRDSSTTAEHDNAFFVNFDQPFDAYLEARRSSFPKHFKQVRRLNRQVEREIGKIEFSFHAPSEEVLSQLIEWKRAQFQQTGLHDVLKPDWTRKMLFLCMNSNEIGFQGVLSTMHIDGKLAATELGIRSHNVLHSWISGYNQDFRSYSPGILLQQRLLEAACEADIQRVDLGTGAEHYKKYYATHERPLQTGVVHAASLSGEMRRTLSRVWSQLERSPVLPGKATGLRKRMDNILSSERDLPNRMRGLIKAISRRR